MTTRGPERSDYDGSMLVLASASPRRVQLLRDAGFSFDVAPQSVDEAIRPGESAEAYVRRVAWEKVRSVSRKSGTIVIGADTTVVIDGLILGKPEGSGEAVHMLKRLSGRTHEVLTGVVVAGDEVLEEVARTTVRFLPLSEEDIAWYVGSGEPDGKAGAYAIQGLASRFVDRIEGSYTNVVGLPIALVARMLRQFGVRA
jgi:septum formation protein